MSIRDDQRSAWRRWAGLFLLILLGGCSPLELSKGISPFWQPKPQVPERIADFWTEYLHRQGGQRTVRGFGGRVMFYGQQDVDPILVDGTLTVYAYDDSKGDPSEQSADKKFVFTREQLANHHSRSDLGHSYSFWLPWDEVGGEEKKITLIARFDDASGKVVMSKPTKQTLFGVRPSADQPATKSASTRQAAKAPQDSQVRPVSFEEMAGRNGANGADGQDPLSATIDLPPSFVRRFRAAVDAAARSQSQGAAPANQAATAAPAPGEGADPTATEKALEPATPPGSAPPPEVRSAPSRFPVQRERTTRPAFGHVRTQPYPAVWPSALPRSPRTDQPNESTVTMPSAPAG